MNWNELDAIESKPASINGIMVVEVQSRRVIMSNAQALAYFGRNDDVISLQRTLGLETDLTDLFQSVVEDLEDNEFTVLEDTSVVLNDEEEMDCNIVFTFATPEKKHLFMKVHPIIDNRPYYMEKFIESRKRPAFVLNVSENLTVNFGNDNFYKCFACNKTSMKLRYKNYFGNLLAEEMRRDYEEVIHAAVKNQVSGVLDVPVQTAMGDVLYFYFDATRLRQVTDDPSVNLFCLLVPKDISEADLNDPFNRTT